LRKNAKFCDECGSPVGWRTLAEYQQVTVLSVDVGRSSPPEGRIENRRPHLGTGDTYRDYRDDYRQMATELGFEGHMAWAAAMDAAID
jgi:hypothetical protein